MLLTHAASLKQPHRMYGGIWLLFYRQGLWDLPLAQGQHSSCLWFILCLLFNACLSPEESRVPFLVARSDLTLVLDPQGSWTRRDLMCCGYEDIGGYALHCVCVCVVSMSCGYALWDQVQVLIFTCVWSWARNGSLSKPQLLNLEYRAVITFRVISYSWVNNNSVWESADTKPFYLYGSSHVAECFWVQRNDI